MWYKLASSDIDSKLTIAIMAYKLTAIKQDEVIKATKLICLPHAFICPEPLLLSLFT